MTLRNSLPKRYALRTSPHGVCGILDVRAINELAVVGEDCCADAELRVGAIGSGFGGDAAGMEGAELEGG